MFTIRILEAFVRRKLLAREPDWKIRFQFENARKENVDGRKDARETDNKDTELRSSIQLHGREIESIPLNKTNPMFTSFFFILNTANTRL